MREISLEKRRENNKRQNDRTIVLTVINVMFKIESKENEIIEQKNKD